MVEDRVFERRRLMRRALRRSQTLVEDGRCMCCDADSQTRVVKARYRLQNETDPDDLDKNIWFLTFNRPLRICEKCRAHGDFGNSAIHVAGILDDELAGRTISRPSGRGGDPEISIDVSELSPLGSSPLEKPTASVRKEGS